MKTKLVLWGTNAQNERLLIALELMPEDNKVKAFTFPEQIATEEFSQLMLKEWRDGNAVEFPDGFSVEERELTLSGSILPDGVKAEREDIVQRAQTEWHFIVLSSRLYHTYHSELNEFKDRIEKALRFEGGLWDELKGFWDKVQVQVRDRNLFREHADALRDRTNELFASLKGLRSKLDEEFERLSKDNFERFNDMLAEVEKKVSDGLRLQPLFDDLKEMQRKFREAKLTKDHRTKIWDRLDNAFKIIKEKRFGSSGASSGAANTGGSGAAGDDRTPGERLNRRYEGLMSAIDKMEKSIKRDEDDLDFQKRKVATTDGQLEAQIRQAKILMIEERIRSKREKLGEMLQTRDELDRRVETQKERDAKKAEQDKILEAKRAAEEKIKSEIKAAADARKEDDDKLSKAAEQLKVEKAPKTDEAATEAKEDSLLDAVLTTVGDSVEDMVDTIKAVGEVVGDKIGDLVEDIKDAWEKSGETVEEAKDEVVEPVVEETAEETTPSPENTSTEPEAPATEEDDTEKKDNNE